MIVHDKSLTKKPCLAPWRACKGLSTFKRWSSNWNESLGFKDTATPSKVAASSGEDLKGRYRRTDKPLTELTEGRTIVTSTLSRSTQSLRRLAMGRETTSCVLLSCCLITTQAQTTPAVTIGNHHPVQTLLPSKRQCGTADNLCRTTPTQELSSSLGVSTTV